MLYQLLTLLPCWPTPFELSFHEEFVLQAYREYYETLAGTGYRDHKDLSDLKKRTSYSMGILLWHRTSVWWRVRQFHSQVVGLKKSVLSPESIPELLRMP